MLEKSIFNSYMVEKGFYEADTNEWQEKQERATSQSVITISESKDEKHWFIKKNGRQIGKENSKIDAIKKAKELDATGASIIKVYNKNGRLVDSL